MQRFGKAAASERGQISDPLEGFKFAIARHPIAITAAIATKRKAVPMATAQRGLGS
jgi:hypothetical protein